MIDSLFKLKSFVTRIATMSEVRSQEYQLTPFERIPSNKIKIKGSVHCDSDQALGKIVFELLDQEEQVIIPSSQHEHIRKIGLWNETCFELFLMLDNGHYIEGNFTTGFNWNLFYFKTYRETPLKEWEIIHMNPIKDVLLSREKSLLIVEFPPEIKSFLIEQKLKSLSLTAVIKTKNGDTLYYAVKHTDTKPNFHHPDSFVPFQ